MSEPYSVADSTWVLPLRTPTIPPATSTNTVAFIGERMVIVEPATVFEEEQRRLDDFIEAQTAAGHELLALLVTHHHPDHIGYAAALRERHGVPLWAHAETAARMRLPVDDTLVDGAEIDLGGGVVVQAVHTPGHAPGHFVYLERSSGIAHAGDMVAGEGFILIDPEDAGDMRQYLDSLARTKSLGTRALVPAHGPVIEDPGALVDHYVAHRLAREAKVLAAVEGADAFDAILTIAYDDTPAVAMPFAARSLRAHLDKLVADDVVARQGDRYRVR